MGMTDDENEASILGIIPDWGSGKAYLLKFDGEDESYWAEEKVLYET